MAPDPPPGRAGAAPRPRPVGARVGGTATAGPGAVAGSDRAGRSGPSRVGWGERARGGGGGRAERPGLAALPVTYTRAHTHSHALTLPPRSVRPVGGLLRPRRRCTRPAKPLAARGGEGWAGVGRSVLPGRQPRLQQLRCCPGEGRWAGSSYWVGVTAPARVTQQLQDCPHHPRCWCQLLAVLSPLTPGQSQCARGSASRLVGLHTRLLRQGMELAGPAHAPQPEQRAVCPPTVRDIPRVLGKAPRRGGFGGGTVGPPAPLTSRQAMWAKHLAGARRGEILRNPKEPPRNRGEMPRSQRTSAHTVGPGAALLTSPCGL